MQRTSVSRLVVPSFLGLILIVAGPAAGETLRIVNWNVSNYTSGRVAEFQTAIYGVYQGRSMSPDIFIGEEFLSQTGVDNFLSILNTAPGSPGDWAAAVFINGPDTDTAFFYRTSKVQMATELSPTGVTVVAEGGVSPNHPRNLQRYDVRLVGHSEPEATISIYGVHMKAGTSGTDQARRLLEGQRMRDDAQSLPAGWNFLVGGDFNVQDSSQSMYVELTGSQSNNNGRFFDPINTPGDWNNNSAFRIVHTQDPSGAGGMDDRHDQILLSASLVDGEGLDYVGDPAIPYSTTTWDDANHSYRSWGNDGTTYNSTMRITNNAMVGTTIAQAIYTATTTAGGHLPVFLDLHLEASCNPCDINCSGGVDATDVSAFVNMLLTPGGSPCSACAGDPDASLAIDGNDIQMFVECVLAN